MKKIIIIGYVWVEPNSSAAGSRMLQLIAFFLKQGYEITFASTAQKGENALDLKCLGIKEAKIELNASSFDDFLKELNPSIVLFDRFMIEEQFGWRVADNCPNAIRILDTEDLHSLRKTRQDAVKKDVEYSTDALLKSDIAKREIAAILRCDLSLIISSFEMELLRFTFKIDQNLLLHLPFMFDVISDEVTEKWKTFEERKHFVTIGNFLHAPNVDAVLQLKKTIWPRIKEKLPAAEIHIYGAYPTQQVLELHSKKEGFLIKGYVDDAIEVVSKAKVVLAPIRFGAGIKGKLTEAMLCGAPSVTTEIGAEGMHAKLPWNGFVVDSEFDVAVKAIELYTDKIIWEQSQNNGVEIINQLYDKEKLTLHFFTQIQRLTLNLEEYRAQNFIGALLQHQTLRSTKYMSKWIEEKNK
jgi:glycosyltransferase involved in cell wall biosynthesis